MKHTLMTTWPVIALFAILLSATTLTSCGEKAQPAKAESEVKSTPKTTQQPTKATGRRVSGNSTTKEPSPNTNHPSPNPVYMGVWGSVGGTGFMLDMNGTEGSYIPYDIAEAKEYGERRQLKLVAYDPKSGRCVINAYLKGKYIGQFEGIFEEAEHTTDDGDTYTFQAYNGIFTSEKGAKLEFHFHFD